MSRKRISYQKEDGAWVFRWSVLKRLMPKRLKFRKSGSCLDDRHRLYREADQDGNIQGNFEDEYNDSESEDR